MYPKNVKALFTVASLIMTILACNFPTFSGTPETSPEEIGATQDPGATQEISSPPTDVPAVQHQTIPVSLPELGSGQAGDFDSSNVLQSKGIIGGDRFTFGRFERPFNANTMDVYFSQLDIVDTAVSQDDTWIFGTIKIKEINATTNLAAKYAVELDTSLDGKGDWLIIASNPSSTDWNVTGVQIYEDANNDVGADLPMLTDENATDGDGFENSVFDQGQGQDPDSAWVRISPNNSSTVEFAIKKSVLGNSARYLISMWAGNSLLDPALFDINDHFTHEQAGAADKGLEFFYPIKAVSEIDNSCRMAVGFQPTGKEAGLCETFIPDVPVPGETVATPCQPAITFVGCLP